MFRCEPCFATCPQKQRQSCKGWYRARYLCHVRDGANWWFDIAMSIPSSENEDCHEDRGPNQLDPCDCCRRQPWEGGARRGYHGGGGGGWGGGGCSSPGPETMYVCIGACMSECTDGRFMCVSAYVCMHIFMYRYIFMYRCMYIYIYMCVCVCVCVCVSARVFVCLRVCLHMMKAYMHACTLKIL